MHNFVVHPNQRACGKIRRLEMEQVNVTTQSANHRDSFLHVLALNLEQQPQARVCRLGILLGYFR